MSQIINNLFVGSYQDALNRNFLINNNIKLVINCAIECNDNYVQLNLSDITVYKINLFDTIDQYIDFDNFMLSIYSIIDSYLSSNFGVLIHCYAGVSRSVTIAAGYLIWKYNMKTRDALCLIKRNRPIAYPNFNFVIQLVNFEQKINPNNNLSTMII